MRCNCHRYNLGNSDSTGKNPYLGVNTIHDIMICRQHNADHVRDVFLRGIPEYIEIDCSNPSCITSDKAIEAANAFLRRCMRHDIDLRGKYSSVEPLTVATEPCYKRNDVVRVQIPTEVISDPVVFHRIMGILKYNHTELWAPTPQDPYLKYKDFSGWKLDNENQSDAGWVGGNYILGSLSPDYSETEQWHEVKEFDDY